MSTLHAAGVWVSDGRRMLLAPTAASVSTGEIVDGLRQLRYGGLSTLVLRDVLVLLAWLALALLATSRAARLQRIWTVQRVKPELAL